ncbi:hypothetical protein D3C80_1187260 [compost metagenome]
MLEVVGIKQQIAPGAIVLDLVVVAALLASVVATVDDARRVLSVNRGGIVEERRRQTVVLSHLPGQLGEAVVLLAFNATRAFASGRVGNGNFVFTIFLLVRTEEPQTILQDRAAQGKGGVVGRETSRGVVLVLSNQVVILHVVVERTVPLVTTRLGDNARNQAGTAAVFSGHAADDDLLFLDDFRVEVGAEGARDRIGDVDAVQIIEVVRRGANGAVDVRIVDARTRRRVAAAGLHAGNQLQVALVATSGRQGFHNAQRQGGAHSGRRHVDGGQRAAGHDDVVNSGGAQSVTDSQLLAADHGDAVCVVGCVAVSFDLDGIVRRRIQAHQACAARRVGYGRLRH